MIMILPSTGLTFARPLILGEFGADIPDRILTQCGLASGLLVSAVIYLALQLAKTRAGWESDRSGMMRIIEGQNDAYETLAQSHAKMEGILLALQASRGGR